MSGQKLLGKSRQDAAIVVFQVLHHSQTEASNQNVTKRNFKFRKF
jgi:hypothetical protein